MKLSEFVTMALTDPAFQERLKNIKDEENKSLWNQIVEAITELINTLGITIPKGSILAGALKSSMDLINANQKQLKEDSKPALNLEILENSEEFKEYPDHLGENMDGPSLADWQAYNRSMSKDDSLADSPINKELYEKYLLLCGK
jgi:hypothetical protein